MGIRNTKRKEQYSTDSYEPLNIVAVSQDDKNVTLAARDFDKLLACSDLVLFACQSKQDLPYGRIKKVLTQFYTCR